MSSDDQQAGTSAVRSALSGSGFSVRMAWRWAPYWLIKLVVVNLLSALTPAGQVAAVAWLVRSADQGVGSYLPPLIVLCLLVGLSLVLGDLIWMTNQRARNRLRRRYQDRLMHAVVALSPQELARESTASTIQACRNGLFDIGRLITEVIAAVAAIVTAVSLCISVWAISPAAGILVVAALIPSLIIFAWGSKMQDRAFVPVARWERRANYQVEQLVSQRTATELITLGAGQRIARMVDDSQQHVDRLMDRILVLLTRGNTVGGLATAALLAAALIGVLTHGGGGAGIAAGIVGVIAGLTATRGAGSAYGDLMAIAPKVRMFRTFVGDAATPSPTEVCAAVESLDGDDLVVRYPGVDRCALAGVTIRARRGEIVALVGVNGAGKTTAVNALLGIVDTTSGQVRIDDADAANLSSAQRLSHFGLLTQEFGRYEFTIREAVRIGRPDGEVGDDEIWAALDSAHLSSVVRQLPDGLDTQLGPQFGGVGLSGGQWQRLALARIYLRGAGIWVLDEPTSAIDAEAEQQIFAELQRTKAGRITIVVSHRAWTLKGMDRIYVLDDGRVVQQGDYDELLGAGGRFAEIFAEQQS